MNKSRIIIFGCGTGGLRAFEALGSKHEVVAFLDNDEKKQRTRFCGKPVYGPTQIPDIEYDRIVVASQYSDIICVQLVELSFDETKIEILPQQILFNTRKRQSILQRLAMVAFLRAAAVYLELSANARIAKARRNAQDLS